VAIDPLCVTARATISQGLSESIHDLMASICMASICVATVRSISIHGDAARPEAVSSTS